MINVHEDTFEKCSNKFKLQIPQRKLIRLQKLFNVLQGSDTYRSEN